MHELTRTIMELSARGQSSQEVAVQLGLSPHLVRAHLGDALKELNAHSKLEAVIILARRGEINP